MGPVSRSGNGSGTEGRTGTGVDANPSRGCGGGILEEDSNSALARSATVSVAAENAGGDSVHPIGRQVGIAISGGLPGAEGKVWRG